MQFRYKLVSSQEKPANDFVHFKLIFQILKTIIIVIGDFNVEPNGANYEQFISDLLLSVSKSHKPNLHCWIITNRPNSFQESLSREVIKTGLSDFLKMSLTVMEMFYNKQKPKIIQHIESIRIFPMKLSCLN